MFYIRTADRLERTATWLEKLDGGLDHLRGVLFDDALGHRRRARRRHGPPRRRLRCEWKATLDDPDRLARFVEFVNAPDVATTPVWVTERGQRVPA